jgi:hypothetical protein
MRNCRCIALAIHFEEGISEEVKSRLLESLRQFIATCKPNEIQHVEIDDRYDDEVIHS